MQDLVGKKREIIDVLLKKGILISSELLKGIENDEQISTIMESLNSQQNNETLIIDTTIMGTESRSNKQAAGVQEEHQKKGEIRIVQSYKEEPKKREPQDFVDYFNNRYKSIERILKQRQELKGTISINKIPTKKDKESLAIIGMVNNKQTTKNGNLVLVIEDPTGQTKIIINKSKPALFNEAADIVLDETIGILGVNAGTVIFGNKIIWPDVPTNKELKKTEEEKYTLFLSDLHVGSSKFLPEDFEKFIRWINCKIGNERQKHIARNVDYIFIAGDLVDGCGIYPEQDKELLTKDIHQQYRECADLLKQIPKQIQLIICPGNHDAMRISEPQPPLSKHFAKPIY